MRARTQRNSEGRATKQGARRGQYKARGRPRKHPLPDISKKEVVEITSDGPDFNVEVNVYKRHLRRPGPSPRVLGQAADRLRHEQEAADRLRH